MKRILHILIIGLVCSCQSARQETERINNCKTYFQLVLITLRDKLESDKSENEIKRVGGQVRLDSSLLFYFVPASCSIEDLNKEDQTIFSNLKLKLEAGKND